MNEKRIKELALQAKQYANYLPDPQGKEYTQVVMEKFAELIAMDCMSICEELGDKGLDGHYCADEIKKHFGVKV